MSDPDVQGVLDHWVSVAPQSGIQVVGVAVVDLRNGQRWAVNGDVQLSYMSSPKFAWTTFAVATAGIAAAEPYAGPVFRYSDNVAAGSMIDLAGGLDRVNDYWYRVLGMNGSCTQSWSYGTTRVYGGDCGRPTLPAWVNQGITSWNHHTADDMVTFLSALWNGTIPGLDAAGRQKVLEWSLLSPDALDPNGDGTLTGYLPRAIWPSAHHKVGWYWDPFRSASDIGVIETPQLPYAMAIAVYEGASSAAQQQYMASVSCDVYRALTGDDDWSCATQTYVPDVEREAMLHTYEALERPGGLNGQHVYDITFMTRDNSTFGNSGRVASSVSIRPKTFFVGNYIATLHSGNGGRRTDLYCNGLLTTTSPVDGGNGLVSVVCDQELIVEGRELYYYTD